MQDNAAKANSSAMQPTVEELKERFDALQWEFEQAVAEEQSNFAFLAQCREMCRTTEATFESSGDYGDLQAWQEAESRWVRARETHSEARERKTTLKIQVETMRYQMRRLDSMMPS